MPPCLLTGGRINSARFPYSVDPAQDVLPGFGPGPRINFWYLPGTGEALNVATPAFPAATQECAPDFRSGRHSGGGLNVAFCDGHVKFTKTQAVLESTRRLQAGQPNGWNPANPN